MAERSPLPDAMVNSTGWSFLAMSGSRTQYTRKALDRSAISTMSAINFLIIPTVDSLASACLAALVMKNAQTFMGHSNAIFRAPL